MFYWFCYPATTDLFLCHFDEGEISFFWNRFPARLRHSGGLTLVPQVRNDSFFEAFHQFKILNKTFKSISLPFFNYRQQTIRQTKFRFRTA